MACIQSTNDIIMGQLAIPYEGVNFWLNMFYPIGIAVASYLLGYVLVMLCALVRPVVVLCPIF